MLKLTDGAKKAVYIGSLCSTAYLAVYVARNILGSVSPQMIADGVFTEAQIGTLSSLYFVCYAVGQLVNGIVGDKVRGKYMIGIGLVLAGICNAAFSAFSHSVYASYISYALTGFSLAMIYAPMTKIVAENTEAVYAPRCSLGYTLASFLGSPCAGLLAAALVWQWVFAVSSGILIFMGVVCFVVFTIMERRGIITYGKYKLPKQSGGSIRVLIRHRIIRFALVAMLTGVVRTTVVFWLPTFLSQYLGFSPKAAALLYTVGTLLISSSVFAAVFTYERLGRNTDLTMLLAFSASAVCFLLVYFVRIPVLGVALMVLAITTGNCASNILWSTYCPSLRDTGMVSGATGFLDFSSYMAAAAASSLFSNAVEDVGWGPLILVWCGLMLIGVFIMLPRRKRAAV